MQVVTKKIRIYPKNKDKYHQLCDLSRACYNKMVAFKRDYQNDTRKFQDHRTEIMNEVKTWSNYQSHVMQEACRKADITNKAIIKKRKQGKKCDLHFKSRKDTVQGFDIQKLPKNGIYPRFLGKVYITESVPEYAINKSARVVNENDQWYLCCLDTIEIPKTRDLSKVVALDCGVRTFQTCYSPSEVSTLGDGFFNDRLLPLYLALDKLISKKSKLSSVNKEQQVVKDLHRHYDKRIKKLRSRIKNLIEDLHKKCANYLTEEFDIILIPTFETKGMSKIGNRKLNSKSVRAMIGLKHYQFKETLKWFSKKKGGVVLEVDESYTSKMNPFTKELMNIGSSKTFKHGSETYDRDINGARNIFIKNTLFNNGE